MAESRTYIRITKTRYEDLPIPQDFLNKRGDFYHPVTDGTEAVKMAQSNATIKQAIEAWRASAVSYIKHADGVAPERVSYDEATHIIIGIPNLSQREIVTLLNVASALGFNDLPVIFAHDEIREYLSTGIMPLL